MIQKQGKRKRIFYVPGMISLLFIPLFCLIYFYKTNSFLVRGSLDISLVPNNEDFEKYKIKDLRKYKEFRFNGGNIQAIKLEELRSYVRDLVRKYDTVNGAKIHFGSKTDYTTFINVINMLTVEKIPTWAPYKDDIFVIASAKPKPSKNKINLMYCNYEAVNKNRWVEEEEERQWEYNLSLYKKHWILFAAYFGLLFLNIFVLVKLNKNG